MPQHSPAVDFSEVGATPGEADIVRPDDAPHLPAVIDDRPAFLTRDKPLIDTIPDRWISYLHSTVAIAEAPDQYPITRAEIGVFIELCARYALDPFAKEAWLAKSKRGKLLTMVARDGLRKIAQRNALHVDGDVVHENDSFEVVRTADGNRTVTHSYKVTGVDGGRGRIVGAWAEVRDGGPLGKPMGFFFAPLSEYKPASASEYSVWGKQVSVMILGAAERTAIRQATPLGGIVAIGEHESAFARGTVGDVDSDGQAVGLVLGPEIEAIIERAEKLGNGTYSDRAMIEMQVADAKGNLIPERVAEFIATATAELDATPQDAVVVDEAPQGDLSGEQPEAAVPTPEGDDAPQAPPAAVEASQSPDPERIAALRRRGSELLNAAESLRDAGDPRADEVFEEWEQICNEVEAAGNVDQGSLPL